MQQTARQIDAFNLTSMHKILDPKNYRKSIGAISFKKMDMARANTTIQLASRRTSMGKTFRKLTVRNNPTQDRGWRTGRDVADKVAHFDEYLSDPGILTDYKMMSHIGKGSFSTVSLAVHRETGRSYAMKTYDKMDTLEWHRLDSIKRQIKHLNKIDHPNVIRLLSVVKEKKKLQLLMDNGGKQSLSGLLRKSKRFTEEKARDYMRQIIEAISHCHSRGVSHRDIKPENILVNDQGHVTVIDFGFSASSNSKLTTYCGTPPFMCPEITKKVPYSGAAADVWALGIMLYLLVMGTLPFKATNQAELFRLIQQGKYPKRETFSKNLRSLLDRMLCTEPSNRIYSRNLLSEPWFK